MKPKVLLFDIETSPNLAYVWGKYQQDVVAFEEEWKIISVSYKWLDEKAVHCKALCDYKKGHKELQLLSHIWDLFDSADVVIAHNGDSFDIRKVKARMLAHNMQPPSMFSTVDTLKVARKYFKLNSNKLNDIAKTLQIGEKVKHTGFDLWLGCIRDDKKSWGLLKKYNKQDVRLLEKVYLAMLPWMEKHPNMALLEGHSGCPKCGSEEIRKDGFRANSMTLSQQWECKNCGGKFATGVKRHG